MLVYQYQHLFGHKRDAVPIRAATLMNLDNTTERSQTQKATCFVIHIDEVSRIESRLVVVRAWGEGEIETDG